MSYPLMGMGLSFWDAFFEAVSGCTTTGLSTLNTVEGRPLTFLFARSWMQWYGGLGVVILSIALVIQPGLVAKGLAVTEAEEDDLVGGTKAHARRMFIVYGVLTAAGIGLLWVSSGELFNAVVYGLAAVSTGGFSPHDNSAAGFGGAVVQTIVIVICLAGATPLVFYHNVFREGWHRNVNMLQLAALIILSGAGMLILAGFMWVDGIALSPQRIGDAAFLACSAQSTAGFATTEVGQLNPGAKLTLMVSMLVGGGVGSTAGGFKLLRLLFLFTLVRWFIVRTSFTKHAVLIPRLSGRRLEGPEMQDALCLVILFAMAVVISWLPFVTMGYDPFDSLFEVVSALGTVGLSTGVIGSDLPNSLKAVICIDMLLGRLEIMPWLVLVYPFTWFGRR